MRRSRKGTCCSASTRSRRIRRRSEEGRARRSRAERETAQGLARPDDCRRRKGQCPVRARRSRTTTDRPSSSSLQQTLARSHAASSRDPSSAMSARMSCRADGLSRFCRHPYSLGVGRPPRTKVLRRIRCSVKGRSKRFSQGRGTKRPADLLVTPEGRTPHKASVMPRPPRSWPGTPLLSSCFKKSFRFSNCKNYNLCVHKQYSARLSGDQESWYRPAFRGPVICVVLCLLQQQCRLG
jgi:hypothetical protein